MATIHVGLYFVMGDFNLTPRLTEQLRDLLRHENDLRIIKQLIQNIILFILP